MYYNKLFIKYLKISLIFLFIIFATSLIFLLLYKRYQNDELNLIHIYNQIDNNSLSFLNLSSLSFKNILAYYLIYLNIGIIIYLLLAIILAIYTTNSNNYYNKILITAPINYKKDLKKKVFLALLNLIIVDFLIYIFLLIYFSFYKTNILGLTLLTLAIFCSQLTIYALVLAISTFINNNYIYLISIIILIVFIIISIIYKMLDFKILAYICPLCYFDYLDIITNNNIQIDYLASMVIITIFGFNLALCEYTRKGGLSHE